jgi:oligosaccharyl transferase (archaeosortase A-associated)
MSSLTKKIVVILLLILIFSIAFIIRAILPYHDVFVNNWMKLDGNDAYYYMRLVDSYVYNFPNFNTFEPFLRFPDGLNTGTVNLFAAIMAFLIKLFNFGPFNQTFVDVFGIYFPAVLGSLAIIPIFFIGKVLFNKWIGLLSSALLAVMPGEILGRTSLGYTDRDAMSVILSELTILFIIIAIKFVIQHPLSAGNLKHPDRNTIKALIYSIVAGLILGFYLCVWVGGFFIVITLIAFIIMQLLINHFTNGQSFSLVAVNSIIILLSLILFVLYSTSTFYLSLLLFALFAPMIFLLYSHYSKKLSLKPLYFVLFLIAVPIAGVFITYLVNPDFVQYFTEIIIHYLPFSSTEVTVMESQSILFPGGNFTFEIIWGNFTTTIILGLIALIVLIYQQVKHRNELNLLFITWCILILIVTLLTRRIALLLSINLALLTGYLFWEILKKIGLKEESENMQEITAQRSQQIDKGKKGKQKAFKKYKRQTHANYGLITFVLICCLLAGLLPNSISSFQAGSHAPFVPDNGWCEALDWLKINSPDPFNDPQFYYKTYSTPFKYPDSAYTIISWWDYGFWIVRNAHRIPVCDPGGGDRINTAKYLVAQTSTSANKMMDDLKSKYVVIDYDSVMGKFYAIAIHSGAKAEDYFDVFYQQSGKNMNPVMVYFPQYYLSEAIRLYNFDGKEVIPQTVSVISYVEKKANQSQNIKEITGLKTFSSYAEAETFIKNQKSGNYRIVSFDPFSSPILIEASTNYKMAYASKSKASNTGSHVVSFVKVFEYIH